jgi:aryl-alcohol dehydrogenase-like predicted oxidoreductase
MDYVRLGSTRMKISRIALGCMSYGDPTTSNAHRWALDDDGAQPFFRQAVEMGGTFWDTANTYHRLGRRRKWLVVRGQAPSRSRRPWRPCTTS